MAADDVPNIDQWLSCLSRFEAGFVSANKTIFAPEQPDPAETVLTDARNALLALTADPDAISHVSSQGNAGAVSLALQAQDLLAETENSSPAAALLRRALMHQPNHLLLQKMLRRATGTKDTDLTERFCSSPFENIETDPSGDIYFCCPAWQPIPIGNLNHDAIGDLWNSAPAQAIRNSIHDGSYRYCSRTHCPKLSGHTLPLQDSPGNSRLTRIAADRQTQLGRGPAKIILSHDRSCNLSCPSCRIGLILARSAEQKRLNHMADTVLFPLMANAERLRVTSSGDPFGSAHFQYILRHLDRAQNPGMRLDLQTNGVLLTPALWETLSLEGRVGLLLISVDAARPETYDIVRRGGSWATLSKNLSFFAQLRREQRIERLRLDFVVQALNWAEMPDFVRMARRFGADSVKFQMIRSWGTYTADEFASVNISDPAHPEYSGFLDVLRSPELSTPYVELWGMEPALMDAKPHKKNYHIDA